MRQIKVDGLFFDGGTYQAFLKVVSLEKGWKHKIREYVWEKTYDGEKPKVKDIDVYVLDDGLKMFQYLYTKKKVIER